MKKKSNKRIGFFDTEISNNATKVGWKNFAELQYAVGCNYVLEFDQGKKVSEAMGSFLDPKDLAKSLDSCDYVVGFNNHSFDNSLVLTKAGPSTFISKSFDVYEDVCALTGIQYMTSLGRLGRYTIGESKTNGVDGSKVEQMWKDGKHAEVTEYCEQDCRLLANIFLFGVQYGYVILAPNKNQELFGSMVIQLPVPKWKQFVV